VFSVLLCIHMESVLPTVRNKPEAVSKGTASMFCQNIILSLCISANCSDDTFAVPIVVRITAETTENATGITELL